MKTILSIILLTLFISPSAKALDYMCDSWLYRYTLQLDGYSSVLWAYVKDDRSTILAGYTGFIQEQGLYRKYYFYPSQGSETIVSLNAQRIDDKEEKLFGWIDGNLGRGLIADELRCKRINN